ncbi:MAG: hypothetical protein JNK77_02850 [Saprospiraceae bacterium]|nr:hypothetical protein [Saprospiraceae bacterium]
MKNTGNILSQNLLMKRVDHLLEKVADPDNLRLAFWKARKGKSYTRGVLIYQSNLEDNLFKLREQILSGRIEVGNYHFFKVFDPKERQICAPAFSEQVLHHALMNVCHKYFERMQIFDSYASRKGKGVHAALNRAKVFTKSYNWFLKLDVRKFFDSIHHEVLKNQLRRMFKDWRVLDLLEKIIDSYEASPQRGLPIGNLSSQYFANHYLSGLDHFIKEQLHIKAYVRYMDDMVLWCNSKQELKNALTEIKKFVQNYLQCELKPELLNRTERGLPFLGYVLYPEQIRLSQRSKRRFSTKIQDINDKYRSGMWSEAQCQRCALPLIAFTLHADAKSFRKRFAAEGRQPGESWR